MKFFFYKPYSNHEQFYQNIAFLVCFSTIFFTQLSAQDTEQIDDPNPITNYFNIQIGLSKLQVSDIEGLNRPVLISWTSHIIPKIGYSKFISYGGYLGYSGSRNYEDWGFVDAPHLGIGVIGSGHLMPVLEEIMGFRPLRGMLDAEVSVSAGYSFTLDWAGIYGYNYSYYDVKTQLAVKFIPTRNICLRVDLNTPVAPLTAGIGLQF